jgi:hypothetical protein
MLSFICFLVWLNNLPIKHNMCGTMENEINKSLHINGRLSIVARKI